MTRILIGTSVAIAAMALNVVNFSVATLTKTKEYKNESRYDSNISTTSEYTEASTFEDEMRVVYINENDIIKVSRTNTIPQVTVFETELVTEPQIRDLPQVKVLSTKFVTERKIRDLLQDYLSKVVVHEELQVQPVEDFYK